MLDSIDSKGVQMRKIPKISHKMLPTAVWTRIYVPLSWMLFIVQGSTAG